MTDDKTTAASGSGELPLAERDAAHVPGHWLLARLGKRVLRPGGKELTERMLADGPAGRVEGRERVAEVAGYGRFHSVLGGTGPLRQSVVR